LEFYGNKDHYLIWLNGPQMQSTSIMLDEGEIARKALKEMEE
jgi:hypothetical protein